MLEGYLDWYRVVIVRKAEGLPVISRSDRCRPAS